MNLQMEIKYLKTTIQLNHKMKKVNSDSYFMSFEGEYKEVKLQTTCFYTEVTDGELNAVNEALSKINLKEIDSIQFSNK